LTHADDLDLDFFAGNAPAGLELFLRVAFYVAFGIIVIDAVERAEVAAVDHAHSLNETGEGARCECAAGESEDENLCWSKDEPSDVPVTKTTRPSPGIQFIHNQT
jgi:hypothetical protein